MRAGCDAGCGSKSFLKEHFEMMVCVMQRRMHKNEKEDLKGRPRKCRSDRDG